MKQFCLYLITNVINGRVYIGQTNNSKRRWKEHKRDAKKENPVQYVHRAMKHYGAENFTFEVIVSCLTRANLNDLEEELIIQYDSRRNGYNIHKGGYWLIVDEEMRRKMGAANRGKPKPPRSKEYCKNISEAQKLRYKENPESLLKWLGAAWEATRGVSLTEDHRKKIGEGIKKAYAEGRRVSFFKGRKPWSYGHKLPEHVKQKMINTLREKYASGELVIWNKGIKTGIPAWNKGLPPEQQPRYGAKLTEEHKAAIIESNKRRDFNGANNPFFGKKHSEESKRKVSETKTGVPSKKRKFNDEQIRAIRNDNRSLKKIGADYKVSDVTIDNIKKNKIYKNVK